MELVLIVLIIFAIGIVVMLKVRPKIESISQEREKKAKQMDEAQLTNKWGNINLTMVCPHCQEKGKIRTKTVKRKKGISGGKATAAVLTAGISMLATGLSRKEGWTQAHCCNCNNTWDF